MLLTLTVATALRFMAIGGGLYEIWLVDRAWPHRFDLIQPGRGGISRARFWIPAHVSFELALILCLVLYWPVPEVRHWLLAAFVAHAVMRGWSAWRFIPEALRFERGDPALDRKEALRWTEASRWRLVLDLMVGGAMMMALVQAAAR
jgi:hypothetical protein